MASLETITAHLRAQLHPAASADEAVVARHLAFVLFQSIFGLTILTMLPLALALNGRPGAGAAAGLAWIVAPPALAAFLSLTGRLGTALALSSLCLAGALCHIALLTGGSASPVVTGLALVPLIAALARSRMATLAASAAAVAVLLALAVLTGPDIAETMSFAFVSAAATVLGASVAAAGLTGGQQTPGRRTAAEPSHTARDLTIAHAKGGRVIDASPGAADLLGVSASELRGLGLFDLVHVADRPAFLHALSETQASNASRILDVRLRVRRENGASTFLWVEMCCRPASSDDAPGVTATLRDIDGRKRREEEAAALAAEIERAAEARLRFLAQMRSNLPSSAGQGGARCDAHEAGRFASRNAFGPEKRRGGTLVPLRAGVDPAAPAAAPLLALRRA